jgi:bacterial/archaeal transporter family-2 protein
MSDALGVVLMALVGAQLAPQAPINRELSRLTSGISAAFVNFALGLILVVLACAVAGNLGDLGGAWHVPPGHLAGGLLGAGFVLTALFGVGSIGASGVAAAAVTGQLLASLALDATGALNLEQRPLSAGHLVGAAAVLAGTFLVVGGSVNGHVEPSSEDPGAAHGIDLRHHLGPTLMVIGGGVLLGFQHPLNGDLAGSIGDLPASVVNFTVGTTALLAALALSGQLPRLAAIPRVPWYYLCGGVFGAVNATTALALVDRIGAGAVASAAVCGQMIASLALDRAGVLGLHRRPLDAGRLAGAALLVAGTVLVAL